VGVGTNSPQSKLGVLTPSSSYGLTHSNGTVTVGSYVDVAGGWLGTKSNHPLYFFTNDSLPLMTLDTGGTLSLGTSTPNPGFRLHAVGPSFGSGVLGVASSGSGVGVYGQSTNPKGYGVFGQNNAGGFAMYASGNAGQSPEGNGWVKAMLYVNQNGTITRCYNGLSGASGGGCGFSASHTVLGRYLLDFGFAVNDRFVVVTPDYFDSLAGPVQRTAGVQYSSQGNANFVEVVIFGQNASTNEVGFTVVVY